ncbi:D-amino acid dehydrogenase [Agrobacterium vitis]|uniref:D-amino acid dehydrogenase n=1 Tax=Agrobacterium vitis TaxID=373 RepID=A0AAE2UUU0_AGRVI|nr:D-amino acid dehydrogenase [Agrobacterium vitis]MBF2713194.1 D-amino acid dehydrogenase [Agrobacterium vitis]
MKVCVIGAGLAGLTCAWHLARDGHEVVVLEKAPGPGEGASRANGGQLSYSYVTPLAAPGVVRKGFAWMLDGDAPMRLRPQMDTRLWRWLMAFVRASRRSVFEAGIRDMLALAFLSRDVLTTMMTEETLDFSYRKNGKLVVFRDEAELVSAHELVALQARHGSHQSLVNERECIEIEPALAGGTQRIAGGVFTPDEAVGDAYRFCQSLRTCLEERYGVAFHFGLEASALECGGGRTSAVRTRLGLIEADHFVLSSGIDALMLAEPIGLSLPLYPLKGYSLTSPIRVTDRPPAVSITDAQNKVVYAALEGARVGAEGRMRVAGMVDLVGFANDIVTRRTDTLTRQAREAFPCAADWSRADAWSGLRPATPDWKPILGQSDIPGLWLNVGHGGLGFTIACGTGRLVADLIAGRTTPIATQPYALNGRSQTF